MGLLTGYDRIFRQKIIHDDGLIMVIDHRRLTGIITIAGSELCIGQRGLNLLLLESI